MGQARAHLLPRTSPPTASQRRGCGRRSVSAHQPPCEHWSAHSHAHFSVQARGGRRRVMPSFSRHVNRLLVTVYSPRRRAASMGGNKLLVRWEQHESSVMAHLRRLLAAEAFVDVTLCCQGRRLRAHRVLLSACSPYLQE
ncbi:uncharacterized protein LOC126199441 [Schistocerca nitens]|uniref:uncharacterized protein LOC126199441 n=1 Tax=Schistocerca nitens TaxID=7011 RepID=UPI0021196F41|nr:uncharacterized protein LOC126199441 [Schistocerca nitens]